GNEVEGPRLVRLLDRMVGYSKLVAMVEKKGKPRELVELLLRGRLRESDAFTDRARLQELIRPLRASGRDIVLEKDEEHGLFEIVLQTGVNGAQREARVGDGFVTSPEYK